MSVLKKCIVLELNKNWLRTKFRTVEDAIVSLCIDESGIPNMLAIPVGPDGIEGHPINWDEWMKLPVRDCDLAISSPFKAIRVPLVIISPNYGGNALKAPQLTSNAIFERDGLIDQYSGEQLTREQATLDHVIPQDVWKKRGLKGTPHTWRNLVTCKNTRNFQKGNSTNHRAGLKPIRKPKEPPSLPVHILINQPRHPLQAPFFA